MNRFESDMYFRGKEIKSVEGKVREKYDSYIGVKYNNFTVIKILGTVDSDSVARVECVCGTVKLVSFSAIKRGTTRSCGCIKKPREVRTKVGKEVRNRMGDIAVVVEVISATNIKIKFTSTGTIETTTQAGIMKGYFKDRARPSVAGVGYIGVGIYNSSDHNKHYKVWQMMLHRCYDEKVQEKLPTYKGCSVAEEWHNFQNFKKWHLENYVDNWHIDKDILSRVRFVRTLQPILVVVLYSVLSAMKFHILGRYFRFFAHINRLIAKVALGYVLPILACCHSLNVLDLRVLFVWHSYLLARCILHEQVLFLLCQL